MVRYTEEELIKKLREFSKNLNRIPTIKDIREEKGFPSYIAFYYRFGSWNNALKKAGLKINERKDYTKDELLNLLRKKAKELGRPPKGNEIDADKSMPNRSTFDKHFGSTNTALRLAGLEARYEFRKWTKEELLEELRRKAKSLGRSPTQREIDKDPNMPAKGNYRKYFGSLNKAIREAGLLVNYNMKKAELIKLMQKLYLKLNKTPTRTDMNNAKGFPSYTPFVEKFGSYTAACLRAGLTPNDGRNNNIWKAWQKHCEETAKVIYGKIETQKEGLVEGLPDIYVPEQQLFIDAKTCGYKDFKEQIKKYCKNAHKLEFWLIFKGIETKRKRVKYIYAEELAERMKKLGRKDLAVKCYKFIKNVFDEGQKEIIEY